MKIGCYNGIRVGNVYDERRFDGEVWDWRPFLESLGFTDEALIEHARWNWRFVVRCEDDDKTTFFHDLPLSEELSEKYKNVDFLALFISAFVNLKV